MVSFIVSVTESDSHKLLPGKRLEMLIVRYFVVWSLDTDRARHTVHPQTTALDSCCGFQPPFHPTLPLPTISWFFFARKTSQAEKLTKFIESSNASCLVRLSTPKVRNSRQNFWFRRTTALWTNWIKANASNDPANSLAFVIPRISMVLARTWPVSFINFISPLKEDGPRATSWINFSQVDAMTLKLSLS